MEVTGGSLSYAMGIDYSQLAKAKGAIVNYLREIGHSAEEAGKMADEAMNTLESVLQEATKEVENQADAMEVLQAAYEEINRQMEGMEDGAAKEVMEGIAEGIQGVVDEMEAMSQQDMPLDDLGEGATSARQQLRELTEELVNMKLRGEENTEEYQQLLEKVGMLKDAMADTQQAVKGMASDTAALDSVLGAAQLTAGGFSAIMGAMNLVGAGEDTKELAEAQKKLQAAIAVTTGLQSVQNALQKQSALMLGITKIQTLAAAKAENIRTAATGKGVIATGAATVAQKAFNAVAKANPYVLLAMAVLTVVGALVAFTRGSKESEEQNESLNKELEKQVEILSRLQSAYDSVYQLQKKSIENRIDLLKAQGADIDEIRKAEDELAEAERKRIEANEELYGDQMQFFDTYVEQLNAAKNTYEDYNNKVIELESRVAGTLSANEEADLEKYRDLRKQWGQRVDDFREMVDALAAIQMERADFNNRMSIREAQREREDEERRVKAAREAEERRRKRLEDERQYQEELQKARERAEDLENDNLPESVESRVQKINTDYDRQIAAAELAAEKAKNEGKLELAEQYERQIRALRQRRDAEIEQEYADEAKLQQEALDSLLEKYQSFADQQTAIREKYQKDITALEQLRDNAGSAEERLRYEEAIAEAQRQQNEELTDLEVGYGRMAQLEARRAGLEKQILLAWNAGDNRRFNELRNALSAVNKEIDQFTKAMNKKSIGDIVREWAEDLQASDFISAGGELGSVIASIGEAAGNDSTANFGSALELAGNVGAKIASGDYLGAALAVITEIGTAIAEDIEKTKEFQREMKQAAIDADLLRIASMMNTGDSIFGEDIIAGVIGYNDALEDLQKKLDEFKNDIVRTPLMSSGSVLGQSFQANIDEILKHQNYGRVFKTKDYSGWSNFWGTADEFDTLQEFAERNGMALYDEYGNLNKEVLELFKNTYSDLDEEDKQWLDNAIAYSEEYAEAMEGLSNYLTDLFGNVADTIAEQFIESFLKSGQAAMDFDKVVADVARNMVKNLIKSMILEGVMNNYSDQFKEIITSDEYEDENARSAAMLALFTQMGGEIEQLQPYIQSLLEAYQQYLGDLNEESTAMSGNLLQSASQDSVSLLNGQLNAVRTNQSLMLTRIDSILLQLSGIRDDMNSGFGETVRHLEAIDNNTSEGGSMLRQLGIWLG